MDILFMLWRIFVKDHIKWKPMGFLWNRCVVELLFAAKHVFLKLCNYDCYYICAFTLFRIFFFNVSPQWLVMDDFPASSRA